MPKAQCPKCKKWWHGWALKYKDCYCICGEKLEIKEGGKVNERISNV